MLIIQQQSAHLSEEPIDLIISQIFWQFAVELQFIICVEHFFSAHVSW